jgi:hypothetical protein
VNPIEPDLNKLLTLVVWGRKSNSSDERLELLDRYSRGYRLTYALREMYAQGHFKASKIQ